jgi:hypothetical protein
MPSNRDTRSAVRYACAGETSAFSLPLTRGATQQQIAEVWDVTQANVSQIEHTPDIYLSTLRNYVAALGGRLEINAVFPDQTIRLLPGVMDPGGAASLDEPAAPGGTEALTG